jgi:ABC-type multidrug transport system fused ATPase/permease subunit
MLYTAYVGGSLVSLTTFFSTIMKGLGAAARVFELLDAKPSTVRLSEGIKLPANSPPRALSFNNVHFSYPSRPTVPILKGLNLTVEKGRSIAVAGGSGSGKSTLVNLLVRFYDPSSGEIRYGNDEITKFTPESWRERVSMVPQDPALFSQTIAENSKSCL